MFNNANITNFRTFTPNSQNSFNMRKTNLFLFAMITCSMVSCNTQKPETEPKGKDKIGPKELTLQSDIMTPEVLWSMGRIGDVSLSPDHTQVVYSGRSLSVAVPARR